jgi:hypothetical protein
MALQARGRQGSMASQAQEWRRVHNVGGAGRTTLLQARERCCGCGDNACMVDGITDSGWGRWWHVKGLDRGRERWHGGSMEDSMMTQGLQGGLDDDTGSGDVDDGAGSMEIFGGKFW